jgi:cytochrome c biogenesis protein CcdA
MLNLKSFQQKSPQQRFLFILGLVMFAFYMVLGIGLIVWKDFPVNIERTYRILLGVLLIVYAGIRFIRIINQREEE